MEAMAIVFCMLLAHFGDGDAIILLVFSIPCLIIWALAIWCNTGGQQYDHDGNKIDE